MRPMARDLPAAPPFAQSGDASCSCPARHDAACDPAEPPDELVSQIAAGEVIERPASVVRMSTTRSGRRGDARSSAPGGGGVRSIVVEDDRRSDIARRRAARSRCAATRRAQDRDRSPTPEGGDDGFRGEALAAIASCCRSLVITSSQLPAPRRPRCVNRSRRAASLASPGGAAASASTVEVRELSAATGAAQALKTDTESPMRMEAVRR